MEATCWRLLGTIQQLFPLLQWQPLWLQHLLKGFSSCILSQSDHFWSNAFGWIWDDIFNGKSCTYRNQSNHKDPFRSFTRKQSIHKISVSKVKGMSLPSTVTRIFQNQWHPLQMWWWCFASSPQSQSLMSSQLFFPYLKNGYLLIRNRSWCKRPTKN